jgi:GT2 family glycosyltransferase
LEYSIVLTYQHTEERLKLFYACLTSVLEHIAGRAEICVHEVGTKRHLRLPARVKYKFTKYSGVYHRAWALNRCVKTLSKGDMLILMDSDLIVTQEWAEEILSTTTQSIAWGKLSILSESGTTTYLNTSYIDRSKIERIKSPSMGSAAGGAMIVPRALFYSVKGIPEDFMGSWGGEDNAFWAKLTHLGNKIGKFTSEIFHLHHSNSTPRVHHIQRKVVPMLLWNSKQWNKHIELIHDSWGLEVPGDYTSPSISFVSSFSAPRITFAMLSWLRYDKLLNTLEKLYDTLTIPANIVLMVQGAEKLEPEQRRAIRVLAGRFEGKDVFFTNGNIGTGPARRELVRRATNRYYTPYINLADDDTTYTPGSVEAALDLLDEDQSLGVVGIRYKPRMYMLNSQLDPTHLSAIDGKKPIEYVDCTGSASAFIRREVFDTCKIDPFYKIGNWDLDLFLQVRSVGWRMVNYKAFPQMHAINDYGGEWEYRKVRLNRVGINKSSKYFKKKWGLAKAV